jgi:hypothetical protein
LDNYFHYFSEIEEHFQRRRGTTLLLSTLDWALIESWKESGIPLAAVVRGIDDAFDNYDARPRKTRKINSLAYCSQAVLTAAEDMQEAALGTHKPSAGPAIDLKQVADYLEGNAKVIASAVAGAKFPDPARGIASSTAASLRELAAALSTSAPKLEEVEGRLTVLEEKLVAALVATAPESEMVQIREEAEREMAPYKRKMLAAQIEQLRRQYVQRRLLERAGLPRLSLFYMH